MVKYFIVFALPIAVDRFIVSYPTVAQLTVGALLVGAVNWLKVYAVPKLGGAFSRFADDD